MNHILDLQLLEASKDSRNSSAISSITTATSSVDSIARKPKRSPRRVYWCGFGNLFELEFGLGDHLFPENNTTKLLPDTKTNADDVLLYPGGNNELAESFKGKILFFNGESRPQISFSDHMFPVSAVDSNWKNSSGMKAFFMSMHLLTLGREWQNKIFRPETNPRGRYETKDRFLLYAAGNCVRVREEAFSALSNLGKPVEYAAGCKGARNADRNKSNIVKAPNSIADSGWTSNHIAMQPYRFALVMENVKFYGYITEKIINAFLAGCIPIYYGTTEVFDIFHKDAFVYYDSKHPEAALGRIAYLEGNRTAYNEVIQGPILKDGEETIRKYFSWNDELGNGDMKWFIRDMVGYG